jgi:pyruvate kinase
MICKCRAQNKPIIVATQMLDSMEKNLLATRAEVMDVYIAGQFGTDAVMTSGETAQGQFPINVVNTMRTINEQSEDLFHYSKAAEHAKLIKGLSPKNKKIASDIAKLTCPKNEGTLKNVFPYEFVVIFENDLKTIEAISGYRPGANIIAVIDKPDLYTKFGITYGITTYLVDDLNKAKKDYKKIAKNAVDHYSTGSKKYAIYLNGKVAPK